MARCDVCGREFDAERYGVFHPGRDEAFDSIDCALVAGRALGAKAPRELERGETQPPLRPVRPALRPTGAVRSTT